MHIDHLDCAASNSNGGSLILASVVVFPLKKKKTSLESVSGSVNILGHMLPNVAGFVSDFWQWGV